MAEKEVEEEEPLKEVKVEEEEPLVTRNEYVEPVRLNGEERLEIPKEWAGRVKTMLYLDHNSPPSEVTLPRVATALMNVNPEAYNPQFISLGPYHHWKLKKDSASSARGTYQGCGLQISIAEEYKVKTVARVSQTLSEHSQSFISMVKAIEGMKSDIERFYDWKIGDGQCSENFALMMAVDSAFLIRFLFSLFRVHPRPEYTAPAHQAEPSGSRHEQAQPVGTPSPSGFAPHDAGVNLSALQVCIKCDMLKLENQIPLSVLKQVFEKGKDVLAYEHEREFSYLLKKAYTVLSPFEVGKADNQLNIDDALATKSHLLDCMQAIVSPFLQMTADEKDNRPDLPIFQKAKYSLAYFVAAVCGIFITHPLNRGHPDFLTAYNAEQLDRAGIECKSFSNSREQIRFDKYSGTFYLPRITVSHTHTEVFLRNMMALEFNEPARPNSVTRYVGLMDCLIDTPRDVRLLMDCDVIRRTSLMLTDDHVAKMWDGMCQPFFTGHLEPPEELKQALQDELIKKYYKSRIKRALQEFHGEYLSRPWKVIALLIGCCVLAITVIQGYCSFSECTGKSDVKSSTQKWRHGV